MGSRPNSTRGRVSMFELKELELAIGNPEHASGAGVKQAHTSVVGSKL